jgi:hypothetical protein
MRLFSPRISTRRIPPNSATNRGGPGIYLKDIQSNDKGVPYQPFGLDPRRSPATSTAEAHMGSRLPVATPIAVESGRRLRSRYRETYLALPACG